MKLWIKIILIITSVIIALIISMFLFINYISTPSKGVPIKQYDRPAKALLVIDTQEDYLGEHAKMKANYQDIDLFFQRINAIQYSASLRGMKIIYIRQEFDGIFGQMMSKVFMKGTTIKGTEGAKMDKRLQFFSNIDFTKDRGDAFTNPKLDEYLIENQVDELYLCGIDGEYCVFTTAKGALNRKYKVNIFVDGILLGKPENYNDLIQKYDQAGISLINANYMKLN